MGLVEHETSNYENFLLLFFYVKIFKVTLFGKNINNFLQKILLEIKMIKNLDILMEY